MPLPHVTSDRVAPHVGARALLRGELAADSPTLKTRRYFLQHGGLGCAALGLNALLQSDTRGSAVSDETNLAVGVPHFPPRARRVIYLFQSGGPSQLDLWDHKPALARRYGEEVPRSVYPDDRKTTMTSAQTRFPTTPSKFRFQRHRKCGTWYSELLPHLGGIADELCVIKSMTTDAINHDPAITFFQTGSQLPGRPSLGAWLSYGLGSENEDLPTFVAMSSQGSGRPGQPLYDRLWGSGFLPSHHQGVKFRNQGAPVLDIYNPTGVDREMRRQMLDQLAEMNQLRYQATGDPEIQTRIAQYELAYRMQTSVPELLDLSDEPRHVLDEYGSDATRQGTYAYNCLVARRLSERGVRFIQLFHQGWDQHRQLPKQLSQQCGDTDQPTAALIRDLKRRGLLDDTLVVWGGEFGRTVYSQGRLTPEVYGRDHHPGCFTMFLAGGGTKSGISYGQTDDYSANVAEQRVHVHDLQATMLHLLGIDHERLTFRFQGRDYRLTDVHGNVVRDVVA